MKKRNTILIILGFILLLIILASLVKTAGLINKNNSSSKSYNTYTLKTETPISIEGKSSPKLIKTYNANKEVGNYINPNVDHGQKVNQGDKLINYIVNDSTRQQLVNDLNDSQIQVNKLYQKSNERPNDNNVKNDLTKNDNALNEAQRKLSQYDQRVNDSIYASFDGTVNIKNDNENLNDGEAILQLISDDTQIKSTVSEFDLNKIKEGQKVNVSVNSTGQKGKGKILKINTLPTSYDDSESSQSTSTNQEDSDSQLSNPIQNNPSDNKEGTTSKYEVIIGDLDFSVRPGLSINANIPLNTIKLPKSALVRENKVFIVDSNNRVHKKTIRLEHNNGQIIVKKGLKKGDKILKNPKKTLNNGDKIEVSS